MSFRFFLLPATALAWGPITHYAFACKEFDGTEDLQKCVADHPDMISGDDFPDAFAFGSFIGGSNCTGFKNAFHNNAFATQMLLMASDFQSAAPSSFNATKFALGYASHMLSDDVGFYSTTIAPTATYFDWLKVWVYMEAIDASMAAAGGAAAVAVPVLPMAGSEFVSAAATKFKAEVDPTAPLISAGTVAECALVWQEVLRDKTQEALNTLTATWRHQLVYFSNYNASSPEEALRQLEPAKACVSKVWQYYLALVRAPGAKPGVIDDKVAAYIADLFSKGECEPPTTRRGGARRLGPLGLWPEAG